MGNLKSEKVMTKFDIYGFRVIFIELLIGQKAPDGNGFEKVATFLLSFKKLFYSDYSSLLYLFFS